MLRSLRSRLLLSYVILIATVLAISGMALFVLVMQPSVAQSRALPVLTQLRTVSLAVRRELVAQIQTGSPLPQLEARLPELATEYGARIMLINLDANQVVFDSDGAWVGAPFDVDTLDRSVALETADGTVVSGRYRTGDNVSWLIYSLPLGQRAVGRLQIVVARREETLFQFFREGFLTPLCQSGCIAFLLAILLAWLITRSVSRPLRNVAGAAEAIAAGDYNQTLALSGPDEVRSLAQSFNRMSAQVQATQRSQRDLVANVSHDLKTPLTSIKGWSQALLEGMVTEPAQQQRTAAIIYGEAERMSRLVSQLLDLARIESGQLALRREAVDLAALLTSVRDTLTPRAQEKQLYFDLDLQPTRPVVGDFDRLVQVFTNLADNAITHTPAGGRVQIALAPDDDHVLVYVRDTGKGIPGEDLERIFERFYQADKARAHTPGGRGSGLGLSIVRELVDGHGGTVSARSLVGQGTEFAVRLPVGDAHSAETRISGARR